MKRFGIERCDEGGTLFDNDGNPIDHTWSVVDRSQRDDYGHAKEVSNHDTRKSARAEAAERNTDASAFIRDNVPTCAIVALSDQGVRSDSSAASDSSCTAVRSEGHPASVDAWTADSGESRETTG